MNPQQLLAIGPLLVLGAGATVLMLQVALRRSPALARLTTLLVLLAGLVSCVLAADAGTQSVTLLLRADPLALIFSGAFCVGAAVCVCGLGDYLPRLSDQGDEFYILLLLATLGAVVLAYAQHAASLFLGLELLSVPLYALIAYPSRDPAAAEAASKYLVLSGAASATLLFALALFYALSGGLTFAALTTVSDVSAATTTIQALAAVLFVGGMAFKLAAVPFHLWTPDVYEGAPAPVAAFLASIGKAAPFIALLRLALDSGILVLPGIGEVFAALAVASMLGGNLLALTQRDLKRMLAYSSIGHIGYALVVLCVAQDPTQRHFAVEAGAFYMMAYLPAGIAAFLLITLINTSDQEADRADVDEVSGLFWRDPLLAVLLLVALLSLAGVPLTAGFIAKFYIVMAAVSGEHWVLLAAVAAGSALGIYYYLRVIYRMTQKPLTEQAPRVVRWGTQGAVLFLILVILVLGVLPQALTDYLKAAFQV